jgi:D-ribose pyranose/furanose isomerase RbsD
MPEDRDWKTDLREAVSSFGHRNWIVVADSAFPLLTGGGMRQVLVRRDQLTVLEAALRMIEGAPHIKAQVWVDSELSHVPDELAPGIESFRQHLAPLAPAARRAPHEELIARLNAAATEFQVLLLKTESVLPYTTVCCELDCGYWDAEREQQLRAAMKES